MAEKTAFAFDWPACRPPLETYKLDFGIGIVGFGGVARRFHLPAYRQAGFRVEGVSDISEDALAAARADGVPRVTRDYRELLQNDAIDLIDVTVNHKIEGLRVAIVEAAAAAGKHVLMQKPLGQTLAEARQMVEIAAQAGIQLAVNQNARYGPACYAIKQLLTPGRLGQPGLLEIKNIVNSGGGLKLGPGGTIIEWGIHHADLLRWWAGAAPVSVHATMKHKTCVITYEFENGAVGSQIEVTAIAPKSETPIRVWAERGSIVARHRWNPWGPNSWDNESVRFCVANQPKGVGYFALALPGEAPWKTGGKPVYDHCAPIGGFIGVMGEFMQAVAQGRPAPTDGRDNLLSLQMYLAALRSAETGAAIDPRSL